MLDDGVGETTSVVLEVIVSNSVGEGGLRCGWSRGSQNGGPQQMSVGSPFLSGVKLGGYRRERGGGDGLGGCVRLGAKARACRN